MYNVYETVNHERFTLYMYSINIQVYTLVLDKMARLNILDNLSIVKWALSSDNDHEFLTK